MVTTTTMIMIMSTGIITEHATFGGEQRTA
jgi:hypothetical protein